MIVYFVIFLIFYVILPVFFHTNYSIGGFVPFFFFFPFIFGRRRARPRYPNGNTPQSQQTPEDELLNNPYDTRKWEKSKSENYDEYGIRVKNDISRYWYYVGLLVILAASIILLVIRGGYFNL